MPETAIRVEGLSKSYQIDHTLGANYRTLRESLASFAPWSSRRRSRSRRETLWALRDVSFEVPHGVALGIVGRNGAGKSTLLKILSRITRPTTGRAEVRGRLGSLLEVGTGFHPELTGRENVFLNGAILGMSRVEIRRHFDEIVDFAGTERFLDTPVKRYSTGMYMRLAFSVAAYLQTDILVVDEVLSVGDYAFQQKCLGKMEDVASEGRTVLFVSHNMAAVTQLCSRALLLESGTIRMEGAPDEVIAAYLGGGSQDGRVDLSTRTRPAGSGAAFFEWAEVRNGRHEISQDFSIGDTITVAFGLHFAQPRTRAKVLLAIRAADGTPVAWVSSDDSGFAFVSDREPVDISVAFEDIRLYPGSYHISMWVTDTSDSEEFDRVDDCLMFRIVDGGKLTMRWLPRSTGIVFLTPTWRTGPREPAMEASSHQREQSAIAG